MMKTKSLILATLAVLPLLSGLALADENQVVDCSTWYARWSKTKGGPALVANIPRSMTPIDLNAVQFTDKKIVKKVIVEEVAARRTETDTLEVMARVVNCTKKPVQLEARSSFLDRNQMPAEPTSSWQKIFLAPYATAVYAEKSISRGEVQNYYIELRGALQQQQLVK